MRSIPIIYSPSPDDHPTSPISSVPQFPPLPHLLTTRVGLETATGVERELGDLKLSNKCVQLWRDILHVKRTSRLLRAKHLYISNVRLFVIRDANSVHCASRDVTCEVVLRRDDHGRNSLGGHGVGQIGCVGKMVHAKIEVPGKIISVMQWRN